MSGRSLGAVPRRPRARARAVVAALLASGFAPAARADADLAIVAPPDADIDPAAVASALARARPGLTVLAARADDTVQAAALVHVERAGDGLVAVSVRDREGRYGARVVDPGDRPERMIPAVILELLDALVAGAAPPPVRPAAAPRRAPSEAIASVEVAFGLATRDLTIEGTSIANGRRYDAPAFATVAFAATIHPARAAVRRGPLTWLGFSTHLVRDLGLDSPGPTDLGETIDVPATYQDAYVGALLDVPLTRADDGPVVRGSLGWGMLSFELDPMMMALLRVDRQVPTFLYKQILVGLEGQIPLGTSGVLVTAGLTFSEAYDVGQAVRDVLGSDTESASGIGLHASVRREIVPRLDAVLVGRLRRLETDLEGQPFETSRRELLRATDRYAELSLAVAYRPF